MCIYCCFPRLHRHQIHLISYGFVSLSLILTGLLFTIFAIFQKDSQIGKIWLAGPVGIVVGLVLCGKVIIDWGPAMNARQNSIDSSFIEQFQLGIPNGETKFASPFSSRTPVIVDTKHSPQQYFHFNGDLIPIPANAPLNTSPKNFRQTTTNAYTTLAKQSGASPHVQLNKTRIQNLPPKFQPLKGDVDMGGMDGAIDCIVYAFNSASESNASSYTALPNESLPNTDPPGTVIGNTNALMNSSCVVPYQQQFPKHKRRISAPTQSQSLSSQPGFTASDHECNCAQMSESQCTIDNTSPLLIQHQNTTNVGHSYGSTQRSQSPQKQSQPLLYQGETFIINDRRYFI